LAQAKSGDTVKVHYTGRLTDGTVFDTTRDDEPLEFKLGENRVITGFEEAVLGMCPGESKKVRVGVNKAYGPYRQDMVVEVERDQFPSYMEPKVGLHLEIRSAGDQTIMVQVIRVSVSSVTLDGNHPLAGKDLDFEIELIEVCDVQDA
jgi:peptidylprolyl isomerase